MTNAVLLLTTYVHCARRALMNPVVDSKFE